MNTPKTDKVCKQLIGAQFDGHPLVDLSRQLETQVNELREALQTIYIKTIDIDSRETARAILEKTK